VTIPRLPRVPRALAALGAVLVVLAPSCGVEAGTTTTAASDASAPVVVLEPRPEPPSAPVEPAVVSPAPVRAVSRDDLLNEAQATPRAVRPDAERSDLLHVAYVSGVAPCHGARVAIDEGPATVRVLLFIGTPPEGANAPCYTALQAHEMVVSLDRPLGTRELLY
jgi:hypothetical protein